MASIIVTLLGEDKPGLVDHLSSIVSAHGGNWEQSQMAHLGGKFAGVLLAQVPAANSDRLLAALRELDHGDALHISAQPAGAATARANSQRVKITLTGNDRAGVVHAITHALAERNVNIERFESEVVSASMGGGVLFNASIVAEAPGEVALEQLRIDLEALANEMMVEVEPEDRDEAHRAQASRP